MKKWTCCGNCISRRLDSDYMLSENSPLIAFSCTGHCMHFFEVHLPLNSSISFPPASSIQLWSHTHCPYCRCIGLRAKTQLNIFDFQVFQCMFLWWRTVWVAGVCMEIGVAHIVITLCAKYSCMHSSFAFTYLDHVTFHLKQYVFKNWLLKLSLCFISINLPYYLFLAPFFTVSSWWPQNKHLCELST